MLQSKWMQIAAGGALLLALVFNFWFWRGRGPGQAVSTGATQSGRAQASAADTGGAQTAVDSLLVAISEGRPQAAEPHRLGALLAQPAVWGQDPFAFPEPPRPVAQPPASAGAAQSESVEPPAWRLTAVLAGEGRRVAIIDGRSYGEGDGIDGGVVQRITGGSVVIRWQGQTVRLELRPHPFRIPQP